MTTQQENELPKTTEEEKVPTPKKSGKPTVKRILYGVLAVAVAAVCFFAGMLTYASIIDPQMRSLLNLKAAIQTNYYEEITDEEFYNTLFSAVNNDLLDPYSYYMTADEYDATQTRATGKRSGLGLVFSTRNEEGEPQMLVNRVCGNSPSEEAGIAEGDYLVGFGKTETEFFDSEVFQEFSDFLEELATGEKFFVKLRSGAGERVASLSKEIYVENYVFYRTNTTAYRFTGKKATTLTEGGKPLASLNEQTAYIRLTEFNGNAGAQFEGAMAQFKKDGKKHLVLDLRDNGGGYLNILQEIAAFFCKGATGINPVVAVANSQNAKQNYRAKKSLYNDYFKKDSKICVLANVNTASASEALMGCMLDYGATMYENICLTRYKDEARTYGKGIMQTTYPLGLGRVDAVKLTTARICWPKSGKCIQGVGITDKDGAKSVAPSSVVDKELESALAQLFE